MTKKLIPLLIVVAVGTYSFAEPFDPWKNRPGVLRAANILLDEIEHFDEALHEAKAPTQTIQMVHHFEETVDEFILEVKNMCNYQYASQEMDHIRKDIQVIRQAVQYDPYLMKWPKVQMEWQHVRSAYRNLDHEMLYWNKVWSEAEVAQLKAEMEEIERAHKE